MSIETDWLVILKNMFLAKMYESYIDVKATKKVNFIISLIDFIHIII